MNEHVCFRIIYSFYTFFQVTLKQNMRVHLGDENAQIFAKKLLEVGDGKIAAGPSGYIKMPSDFCNMVSTVAELISVIYPVIAENYHDVDWLT